MEKPRKHSPSILVVDDNRINRIVLEARLIENGYQVTLAENGREAMDLLLKEPEDATGEKAGALSFDAVILDIMMPEIDGIQVLKALRKVRTSIEVPVIMATAKDQSEDVVSALENGANDYVTKPIDMAILLARLATQISLKRSYQALKEAQRSLIHVAKMETVGLLAAGVAHEIRNPLAQIQMASDGISHLKELKESESAQTLAEIMNAAIEMADSVVQRLMKCSSSAKLPLKTCELDPLVENTLEILKDELLEAAVKLTLDLDTSPELVRVAADELTQVLINIVMNAIQAMPGGGELSVRTEQRILSGLPQDEGSRTGNRPRNGDKVCAIDIEDTGQGIDPEHLNSIFDAFFTTRPTGSGTGLGLTIAKKVIDLHEGILEVANREDRQGTRVSILLPLSGGFQTTV